MPQDIFMEAFIEILKYTFPAALMLLLTYLLLSSFVDNEEKRRQFYLRKNLQKKAEQRDAKSNVENEPTQSQTVSVSKSYISALENELKEEKILDTMMKKSLCRAYMH